MDEFMNLRRMRQDPFIRDLVREIHLDYRKFIQPYFVVDKLKAREEIPGLTGVYRDTPDTLMKQIEADLKAGVSKALLFGVPGKKAKSGFDFDFTCNQIARIKKEFGNALWLAVDVCLCSYTHSGQCGIITAEQDHVINSATVHELAHAAHSFAEAGADCVAPSDMMDGRIRAIRNRLDENHFERTLILSYSAKFHSKFYGPFRVAADSAPRFTPVSAKAKPVRTLRDRATYQIDPARPSDALLSSLRDDAEGADILMVKPGLPYLDMIRELSIQIPKPWAVYEVSGEYAAIEMLAENGLIDGPKAHLEAWTAFIRAGAECIISYGSRHAREWIENDLFQTE